MLYHATLFPVKKFVPRVPLIRCDNEDQTIPRISFSEKSEFHAVSAIPSITENLNRMLEFGLYPTLYLYTYPEEDCQVVRSVEEEPHGIRLLPSGYVQDYVPDADLTGECWLLESPDPSKIHLQTYEIKDILYDIVDGQSQLIHISMDVVAKKKEDNIPKLFHKFGIKKSLDDPRFSEFYYSGNENGFLGNILKIFSERKELLL